MSKLHWPQPALNYNHEDKSEKEIVLKQHKLEKGFPDIHSPKKITEDRSFLKSKGSQNKLQDSVILPEIDLQPKNNHNLQQSMVN